MGRQVLVAGCVWDRDLSRPCGSTGLISALHTPLPAWDSITSPFPCDREIHHHTIIRFRKALRNLPAPLILQLEKERGRGLCLATWPARAKLGLEPEVSEPAKSFLVLYVASC